MFVRLYPKVEKSDQDQRLRQTNKDRRSKWTGSKQMLKQPNPNRRSRQIRLD